MTDIYSIPIGTNMFMAHHALKAKLATPPTVPVPQPMQLTTPAYPTHQYMLPTGYQFPSNPLPPLFPHLASHTQTESTSTACDIQSSSPVYDIDATVEDLCAKYKLDGDILEGLKRLRFELGDNLTWVAEESWKEARFVTLTWAQVLKSYKDLRKKNWKLRLQYSIAIQYIINNYIVYTFYLQYLTPAFNSTGIICNGFTVGSSTECNLKTKRFNTKLYITRVAKPPNCLISCNLAACLQQRDFGVVMLLNVVPISVQPNFTRNGDITCKHCIQQRLT